MAMPVRHPSATRPHRERARASRLGPASPAFKAVELAQRGRMILDVAETDLAAAEELLGPFHETTWAFRRALTDARNSWDRLRAQYGRTILEAALEEPPATVLTLGRSSNGDPGAILIAIAGQTFGVRRVAGTADAPQIWRLTRLPLAVDGPYHACRLADGSTRCDCAQWTFQIAEISDAFCKHLAALDALGWI